MTCLLKGDVRTGAKPRFIAAQHTLKNGLDHAKFLRCTGLFEIQRHALQRLVSKGDVANVFKTALIGPKINAEHCDKASLGFQRGQAMQAVGIDKGEIPRLKMKNFMVLRYFKRPFQR